MSTKTKPCEKSSANPTEMNDEDDLQSSYGMKVADQKQCIFEDAYKSEGVENSQDIDSTLKGSDRFADVNDSLALIKVGKACSNTTFESQSQYFQTPLTEPMPSKFRNYKPTQKSSEKETVIENKVTRCQGHVCTPFNFSFTGCDSQCDCDMSINESDMTLNSKCAGFNKSCKDIDTHQTQAGSASLNSRQNCKQTVSRTQLANVDVFKESQLVSEGKYGISDCILNSENIKSQQSKQALISGTQYYTEANCQFQNSQSNSQILSSPAFNQTGLIVDSQFNQTGLIIDSQDNGEHSDGDMFEDSFNNSDVLSQIEELDANVSQAVKSQTDDKISVAETDPDVTSHTQSLMGSLKKRTLGTCRKRQRRKSSFGSDIASIELEMQKRQCDNNLSTNDRLQDTALEDNTESEKVFKFMSGSRSHNLRSEVNDTVNIEVRTELQKCDISTERELSLVHDCAVNICDKRTNDRTVLESANSMPTEPETPVVERTLQDRLKKKLQVCLQKSR